MHPRFFGLAWVRPTRSPCMYLLTIRDGLQTRHIGPYSTPQEAAAQLDQLLRDSGERARWQIHELEAPQGLAAAARPVVAGQKPVAAA